jgi:CheY-like chemotaxis protein
LPILATNPPPKFGTTIKIGRRIMAESTAKRPNTILIVHENDAVAKVVVEILESADFLVLHANSGYNALALAAGHLGGIDLLLADLKTTGMSGPDLGAALRQSRPAIHVMFMSSFPGGDLLVLNYGWAFIDKLYVRAKLVEMVNVVLHTSDKSQSSHQYDTRIESGEE